MPRFLLFPSICVLAATSALAGFVAPAKIEPAAAKAERILEDPDSAKKAAPAAKSEAGQAMEKNKILLNRLIAELQRSPRSFIYLRSIGYTETDEQFEKLITANNAIFQSIRIIRRDEQGNRQIPGWPGIALKKEYKTAAR